MRPLRRCVGAAVLVVLEYLSRGHSTAVKVRSAAAIVYARLPFSLGVELIDGTDACFELQRRRDTVHGVVSVALVVLTVRMQVDEAGCDDETRRVDRVSTSDPR